MRVALEAIRRSSLAEVMARYEEINKTLGQIAQQYVSMSACFEGRNPKRSCPDQKRTREKGGLS